LQNNVAKDVGVSILFYVLVADCPLRQRGKTTSFIIILLK